MGVRSLRVSLTILVSRLERRSRQAREWPCGNAPRFKCGLSCRARLYLRLYFALSQSNRGCSPKEFLTHTTIGGGTSRAHVEPPVRSRLLPRFQRLIER